MLITDPTEQFIITSWRRAIYITGYVIQWLIIKTLGLFNQAVVGWRRFNEPEQELTTAPVVDESCSPFVGKNSDETVLAATITHSTSGETHDIVEHLKSFNGFPTAKDVITSFKDGSLNHEEHLVDIITTTGENLQFRNEESLNSPQIQPE